MRTDVSSSVASNICKHFCTNGSLRKASTKALRARDFSTRSSLEMLAASLVHSPEENATAKGDPTASLSAFVNWPSNCPVTNELERERNNTCLSSNSSNSLPQATSRGKPSKQVRHSSRRQPSNSGEGTKSLSSSRSSSCPKSAGARIFPEHPPRAPELKSALLKHQEPP